MWDKILKILNLESIKCLAVRWGADIDSLQVVSEGINLVYKFYSDDVIYYMKITCASLRPKEELAAAIRYQTYLADNGVPICKPIKSINNIFVEEIEYDKHIFMAHVCIEVDGKHMNFDYLEESLFFNWGKSLAKMHKVGSSYKNKYFSFEQSDDGFVEMQQYAIKENSIIQYRLNEVIEGFAALTPNANSFGLCHRDHRKGNVLTDGKGVSFIDFDLPRYDWFMEDISRPFVSSIMQGHNNCQDKIIPYISGYLSEIALPRGDLNKFSLFVMQKALNMYLWTKYNWEGDIVPGGMHKDKWLYLLNKMIIHNEWVLALDNIVQDINIY